MIRTLIVDDDPEMRAFINAVLLLAGGFKVVGEAKNGEEAIDLVMDHHPDLILLDVLMPVMDGLTALPLIRSVSHPNTKIVIITAMLSKGIVQGSNVFDLLSEGVRPDLVVPKEELINTAQSLVDLFKND